MSSQLFNKKEFANIINLNTNYQVSEKWIQKNLVNTSRLLPLQKGLWSKKQIETYLFEQQFIKPDQIKW